MMLRPWSRGSIAWLFGPVPKRAASVNDRLWGSIVRKPTMIYLPIRRKLSLSGRSRTESMPPIRPFRADSESVVPLPGERREPN